MVREDERDQRALDEAWNAKDTRNRKPPAGTPAAGRVFIRRQRAARQRAWYSRGGGALGRLASALVAADHALELARSMGVVQSSSDR